MVLIRRWLLTAFGTLLTFGIFTPSSSLGEYLKYVINDVEKTTIKVGGEFTVTWDSKFKKPRYRPGEKVTFIIDFNCSTICKFVSFKKDYPSSNTLEEAYIDPLKVKLLRVSSVGDANGNEIRDVEVTISIPSLDLNWEKEKATLKSCYFLLTLNVNGREEEFSVNLSLGSS